jgi:hypothetical protein
MHAERIITAWTDLIDRLIVQIEQLHFSYGREKKEKMLSVDPKPP